MQYFGGKQRIAADLAAFIQPHVDQASAYYEPFVGGASVCARICHPQRIASDANKALIEMWLALQRGWLPPSMISEEDYHRIKDTDDPDDPLTAFAGFGCSFAGKWFGGYARSGNRNYALNAANSIKVKLSGLVGVEFRAAEFQFLRPEPGSVVYCDPPYQGTTGYGAVGDFDWEAFWQWSRSLSSHGVTILISEYIAPPGFAVVWEAETKTDIRDRHGLRLPRTERLFRWAR